MHEPSGDTVESAFHAGEVELQGEAGVAERMTRLGPQVIRDYMPDQHRDFFPLLPFLVVGSLDAEAQPWASLLAAPPGFAWSPKAHLLRIDALPAGNDPFAERLQLGAKVGLLGIQPHTRRRNRVNGVIVERDAMGITLAVEQSFGNCPKYIQPRELVYQAREEAPRVQSAARLHDDARALIARADTFFIASAHPNAARGGAMALSHGVDVSHRGGPPGFVHFLGPDQFVIPDFQGNNFFNTLGNLRLWAKAGLLFVDFARGDVLELTVNALARLGTHSLETPHDSGRVLHFEVTGSRYLEGGCPLVVASA